jgi:hypothetical protein
MEKNTIRIGSYNIRNVTGILNPKIRPLSKETSIAHKHLPRT